MPGSIARADRSTEKLMPNEREISYDAVFDFLKRHRFWLMGSALVIIVAIVAAVVRDMQTEQLQLDANVRLASARTADDFQSVARDFPGSKAALMATLFEADLHFQQARWEQATACYQDFINRHPGSMLLPSAKLGLAAVLEAQGKVAEAIKAYQSVVSGFPNSFQAAQSQFAVARIQEADGQLQDARKSYEELIARYPRCGWRGEAEARLQRINLLISVTPSAAHP